MTNAEKLTELIQHGNSKISTTVHGPFNTDIVRIKESVESPNILNNLDDPKCHSAIITYLALYAISATENHIPITSVSDFRERTQKVMDVALSAEHSNNAIDHLIEIIGQLSRPIAKDNLKQTISKKLEEKAKIVEKTTKELKSRMNLSYLGAAFPMIFGLVVNSILLHEGIDAGNILPVAISASILNLIASVEPSEQFSELNKEHASLRKNAEIVLSTHEVKPYTIISALNGIVTSKV